jgi:predicted nucleic acid-binding protein
MGSLSLPSSGRVYVDTVTLIYTVEKHPDYGPILQPFWETVKGGQITAVTSDLTLMEALVMPIRQGDADLQADYERILLKSEILLLPLSQGVLREAARMRATTLSLRTPDALHASTALLNGCALYLTNDRGFRRIAGLTIAVLDDILQS